MASKDTSNNTAESGVPNDASEVLDSIETHPQQELFEFGEETEEQPSEGETLVEDESRKRRTGPCAELRTRFQEGSTFDRKETCNCSRSKDMVVRVNGDRCPFCGKVIDTKINEEKTLGSLSCSSGSGDGEPPFSTSETEPSSGLCQTLVTGLVMVPETTETSLEANQSTEERETMDQRNLGAVGPDLEQNERKIPVVDVSDSSVQIPCPPTMVTFFALQQDHPSIKEKWISLYFVEEAQKCKIDSWITQMEQQQGIKLYPVPFGDECSTQHYTKPFHTISLEDSVKVEFELLSQEPQKFRIRNDQDVCKEIPLHRIKSLCQNRIPGHTVQVLIASLCEQEELCQNHLRLTLKYGHTIRRMLIPIWVCQSQLGPLGQH